MSAADFLTQHGPLLVRLTGRLSRAHCFVVLAPAESPAGRIMRRSGAACVREGDAVGQVLPWKSHSAADWRRRFPGLSLRPGRWLVIVVDVDGDTAMHVDVGPSVVVLN